MINVSRIRVRSYDLDFIDVDWQVSPFNGDIRDYSFYVEKSTRQAGPFYDLVGPIVDKYRVRDNTVRTNLSHYRDTFYRIRVVHVPTGVQQVFPKTSMGVNMAAEPDLEALEMARQERLALRVKDGRQLLIFPRRTMGARCSCYDQTMKRKTRSNCLTCFDTTWAGGYESPLLVWGQITARTVASIDTPITELSLETCVFRLPNYPDVLPGDIIVEAENKRWRIMDNVIKSEKGRAVVRQTGQVKRVSEGDIEYRLPVNQDVFAIEPTNPAEFLNPHNPTMGDVEDVALGYYKRFLNV